MEIDFQRWQRKVNQYLHYLTGQSQPQEIPPALYREMYDSGLKPKIMAFYLVKHYSNHRFYFQFSVWQYETQKMLKFFRLQEIEENVLRKLFNGGLSPILVAENFLQNQEVLPAKTEFDNSPILSSSPPMY